MKIGDKVRFLNAVGGGVVAGFQAGGVVIVRDEDGFDVPTPIGECLVVASDAYDIPQPERDTAAFVASHHGRPDSAATPATAPAAQPEPTPYQAAPLERRGADAVQLWLAWVPTRPEHIDDSAFELYVVNDCNYYVRFALSVRGEDHCELRHEDELEPNSKLYLETVEPGDLAFTEMLAMQAFAFKRGKLYAPKPAYDVPLRIEARKFFRLSTFASNEFFDSRAWLVPVVRDDRPVREPRVDADALQAAMTQRAAQPERRQPARREAKPKAGGPIEVDLHAEALLDTLAGLQPADILDYQLSAFRQAMEANLGHPGRRIVFIHGKGEGVLRKALLRELRTKYKTCRAQDASFQEYGFGATMVTIG